MKRIKKFLDHESVKESSISNVQNIISKLEDILADFSDNGKVRVYPVGGQRFIMRDALNKAFPDGEIQRHRDLVTFCLSISKGTFEVLISPGLSDSQIKEISDRLSYYDFLISSVINHANATHTAFWIIVGKNEIIEGVEAELFRRKMIKESNTEVDPNISDLEDILADISDTKDVSIGHNRLGLSWYSYQELTKNELPHRKDYYRDSFSEINKLINKDHLYDVISEPLTKEEIESIRRRCLVHSNLELFSAKSDRSAILMFVDRDKKEEIIQIANRILKNDHGFIPRIPIKQRLRNLIPSRFRKNESSIVDPNIEALEDLFADISEEYNLEIGKMTSMDVVRLPTFATYEYLMEREFEYDNFTLLEIRKVLSEYLYRVYIDRGKLTRGQALSIRKRCQKYCDLEMTHDGGEFFFFIDKKDKDEVITRIKELESNYLKESINESKDPNIEILEDLFADISEDREVYIEFKDLGLLSEDIWILTRRKIKYSTGSLQNEISKIVDGHIYEVTIRPNITPLEIESIKKRSEIYGNLKMLSIDEGDNVFGFLANHEKISQKLINLIDKHNMMYKESAANQEKDQVLEILQDLFADISDEKNVRISNKKFVLKYDEIEPLTGVKLDRPSFNKIDSIIDDISRGNIYCVDICPEITSQEIETIRRRLNQYDNIRLISIEEHEFYQRIVFLANEEQVIQKLKSFLVSKFFLNESSTVDPNIEILQDIFADISDEVVNVKVQPGNPRGFIYDLYILKMVEERSESNQIRVDDAEFIKLYESLVKGNLYDVGIHARNRTHDKKTDIFYWDIDKSKIDEAVKRAEYKDFGLITRYVNDVRLIFLKNKEEILKNLISYKS